MNRSIIVRGILSDPRHIELDEPLMDVRGAVELTIRYPQSESIEDLFAFIASLPAGQRSKDELDREIQEERAAWNGR